MTVQKCFSSQMMTHLLRWRNPQGSEGRWKQTTQQVGNRCGFIGRRASTEIALCLLATTASVEAVAYATVCIPSFFLRSSSDECYNSILERLKSSLVTTVWSVANLYHNPITFNLYTEEKTIRESMHGFK